MLLEVLRIVHVLVWIFVLTAFLNKKCAYYNVYYLIPIIYILQIFLPFCLLNKIEEAADPENYIKRVNQISDVTIFPKLYDNIKSIFQKYSFASPFSSQGMLIFGLLTSIFALNPPKYL